MNKRIIILLLLLYSTLSTYGQHDLQGEQQLLQAKAALTTTKSTTEKLQLLISISKWYLSKKDNNSTYVNLADSAIKKALQLSKQSQSVWGQANCYLYLSMIEQQRQHYQQGKRYAESAIRFFSQLNELDQLGETYVMLWSNSALSGMHTAAGIPLLKSALVAFHKAGNKKREADCLRELGDIYQISGDLVAAALNLKNSLALYKDVYYPDLQGIYDLLGLTYTRLGDPVEGIRYGLMSIRTAHSLGDNSLSLCTYYNRVGLAYMKLDSMPQANSYLKKSLEIAIKYNNLDYIAQLVYNNTEMLLKWGKPNEALELMTDMKKNFQH